MAKGLRCTTHRIFLAALILAAKYLNDSSPKNKHWANYSVISTQAYSFGFNRTEVNLMEKQLLFLLNWELRITEDDLYRELDYFLQPIRVANEERALRRAIRQQQKQQREQQRALALSMDEAAWVQVPTASYATPPPSRGTSRSRRTTPSRDSVRGVSPPGLYSSNSSYAGSTTSRATTPISEVESEPQPYFYPANEGLYDSPIEIAMERPCVPEKDVYYTSAYRPSTQRKKLPYEITEAELRGLEDSKGTKRIRGMFGQVFSRVSVR
jgi:type II secretory pathway pseudopilin PulG